MIEQASARTPEAIALQAALARYAALTNPKDYLVDAYEAWLEVEG